LGLAQLGKLLANNRRRADLVDRLRAELTGLAGLTVPFGVPTAGSQPAYHIFPVILDPALDRAAFMAHMRSHGIQSSIHYPPIHQFSAFRDEQIGAHLPVTEEAGQCEVTLPLFPTMTEPQIEAVVTAVRSGLAGSRT
jgi:dTDP-4-amino-4,6-dideoxygalactose transaminase